MQNNSYDIDWPSVEREFPPAIHPPRLLAQFAQFLRTQPDGSLGSFTISGNRLCDGALVGGDDLAEYFGLFCGLGDGSQVGFWFCPDSVDVPPEHAPIVLLDHDGLASLIAPSLGEFLWRIADADVEAAGIPYDFQPDPDDEDAIDARPALRDWLAMLGPREQYAQGDSSYESVLKARFDRLVEQSISAYENDLRENPLVQEISQILRPYWMRWVDASQGLRFLGELAWKETVDSIKEYVSVEHQQHLPYYSAEAVEDLVHSMKGQKIPSVELIEISAAGGEVQVTRLDQGKKIPLPESARLVPLILQLREQQVQAAPERGLWHYASLTLGLQGEVSLSRAARAWPQFAAKALMAKATVLVRADLARYPRSVYWQMDARDA